MACRPLTAKEIRYLSHGSVVHFRRWLMTAPDSTFPQAGEILASYNHVALVTELVGVLASRENSENLQEALQRICQKAVTYGHSQVLYYGIEQLQQRQLVVDTPQLFLQAVKADQPLVLNVLAETKVLSTISEFSETSQYAVVLASRHAESETLDALQQYFPMTFQQMKWRCGLESLVVNPTRSLEIFDAMPELFRDTETYHQCLLRAAQLSAASVFDYLLTHQSDPQKRQLAVEMLTQTLRIMPSPNNRPISQVMDQPTSLLMIRRLLEFDRQYYSLHAIPGQPVLQFLLSRDRLTSSSDVTEYLERYCAPPADLSETLMLFVRGAHAPKHLALFYKNPTILEGYRTVSQEFDKYVSKLPETYGKLAMRRMQTILEHFRRHEIPMALYPVVEASESIFAAVEADLVQSADDLVALQNGMRTDTEHLKL